MHTPFRQKYIKLQTTDGRQTETDATLYSISATVSTLRSAKNAANRYDVSFPCSSLMMNFSPSAKQWPTHPVELIRMQLGNVPRCLSWPPNAQQNSCVATVGLSLEPSRRWCLH